MLRQPQRLHRNDNAYATRVGARIQALRLERGLSLQHVAQSGGCSVSALASIEHGLAAMTTCTLNAIAKGIGVQPFDLINYEPDDDDIGFLLEKMRQHPECIKFIRAKVSAL